MDEIKSDIFCSLCSWVIDWARTLKKPLCLVEMTSWCLQLWPPAESQQTTETKQKGTSGTEQLGGVGLEAQTLGTDLMIFKLQQMSEVTSFTPTKKSTRQKTCLQSVWRTFSALPPADRKWLGGQQLSRKQDKISVFVLCTDMEQYLYICKYYMNHLIDSK